MKRAFPQEPKPFFCLPLAAGLSGESEEQEKQGFSGSKRRVRTSAAMLGLALSMGASGALLPGHDDAAAAEPPSPNLALATVLLGLDTASSPVSAAVPEAVQPAPQLTAYHTVESGQTLWQIAQIHRVDIQDIKVANGIQADTILQVGQVLRVPSDSASSSDHSDLTASTASDDSLVETVDSLLQAPKVHAPGDLEGASEMVSDHPASASDGSLASAVQDLEQPNFPIALESSKSEHAQATEFIDERLAPGLEAYPQSDAVIDEVWVSWSIEDSATVFLDLAEDLAKSSLRGNVSSHSQTQGEDLSESANQVDLEPTSANSVQLESASPASVLQSDQFGAASGNIFPTAWNSASRLDDLRASASQSPKFSFQVSSQENYQIRQGDTLADIASAHGLSVSVLAGANGLKDPDFIVAGEALSIPTTSSTEELDFRSELSEPILVASMGSSVFQSPSELSSASSRLARLQETVIDREGDVSKLVQRLGPVEPTSADSAVAFLSQDSPIGQIVEEVSVAPHQPGLADGDELTESVAYSGDSQLDPFVANLLDEVRSIQGGDRLQSARSPQTEIEGDTSAALPQTPAELNEEIALASSSIPESVPVNPEFSSRGGLAPAPAVAVNSTGNSLELQNSQLLAAAPLGSETYAPLNPSSIPRVVSPDMPILPGREQFLPDAPNSFNGYAWPTTGIITSGYGWRWGRMHRGVDIAGPVGTPIVAAAPGVVEAAGWNSGGYGNLVDIRHSDGSMTRYAHNSRLLVRPGQQIAQGQQIAEMGSTGYSTGPHLHFELHLPGQGTVNPIAYLPSR